MIDPHKGNEEFLGTGGQVRGSLHWEIPGPPITQNNTALNPKLPLEEDEFSRASFQPTAHASSIQIWIQAALGDVQVRRKKSKNDQGEIGTAALSPSTLLPTGLPASLLGPGHQIRHLPPRHETALGSKSQAIIWPVFQVAFYSLLR